MKKHLLFTAFVCMHLFAYAQQSACCMKSLTARFASLSADKSFQHAHAAPLPFRYQSEGGKMISFKTSDGPDANAFLVRGSEADSNYIFMFHEWWGLNDYIKQEAEKLQKELGNVTVIALDLYDGKIAKTSDEAVKIIQSLKEERAVAIIDGAINYVGKAAKISTIGWCFGGGWSLQAALLAKKEAVACVLYYGIPETDVNKLKTLHADVLGIFASRDKKINQNVVKEFEQNMKMAGKEVIIKTFDAEHAFANPSNPDYDKKATEEAYRITVNFLKSHLRL